MNVERLRKSISYVVQYKNNMSLSQNPPPLSLSATLVHFWNACIHMIIQISQRKEKKKDEQKKYINLPTCQQKH